LSNGGPVTFFDRLSNHNHQAHQTMINPPPAVPVPQSKTSGLAIASLVLGILAVVLTLICIGPLFAIPAIICGHLACSRIKRSGGALGGKGLAIAGFVTGYASLALLVLMLPLAIPNFVKARNVAQANGCIYNLRQIDSAKQQWVSASGKAADAIPTAQDLAPLMKKGVMPGCPAGGTYTIGNVRTQPTCSIAGHALSPAN